MSRLEILEKSLAKKLSDFDAALARHMQDVKSANGQPLNDKRNGRATMNRWEKQDNALRNKDESIKKTKAATEREKAAIARVKNAEFPACIQELIDNGTLTVWRKFPNYLFVKGGGKARIQYKKGKLWASYFQNLPSDEYTIFKDIYNGLRKKMQEPTP